MISAFVGKPGSGKTLGMVVTAIIFYLRGCKIYSNFDLFIPDENGEKKSISKRIISRGDLDHARNGYMFLDEIAKWIDARVSLSEQSAFVNEILQKFRKRGVNLIWSAQDFWMADIRLRLNTDYVFVPESFYKIWGDEETKIKQDFFNPINTLPLVPFAHLRMRQFDGWFYQNTRYLTQKDIVDIKEFPMLPFVNYYDTKEEITQLSDSEVQKGIKTEYEHAKLLEYHFKLKEPIIPNPNSGSNMKNTYDMEFTVDEELYIIDSMKVDNKLKRLDFRFKLPLTQYRDVEQARNAKTFICFYFPADTKQAYLLPTSEIWNHGKRILPINEPLLTKCIKINGIPEMEPEIVYAPAPISIPVNHAPAIEYRSPIADALEFKKGRVDIMKEYGL